MASRAITITKDDDNDLPTIITSLYVGQAGDISLIMAKDSTEVLLKAVPIGTHLKDLRIRRIRLTGTTAALLVGFI